MKNRFEPQENFGDEQNRLRPIDRHRTYFRDTIGDSVVLTRIGEGEVYMFRFNDDIRDELEKTFNEYAYTDINELGFNLYDVAKFEMLEKRHGESEKQNK